MKWNELKDVSQLESMHQVSFEKPVLIYKHSTRCSTSRMMLDRLERNWKEEEMHHVAPYFLDLISYRDISNAVSANYEVPHESPQVLIVRNGKAIHDASHLGIDYRELASFVHEVQEN